MSLRVGIDGRPLQGNRAGIGRYIFELCKEVDKLLPEATFFVYSPSPVEMPVMSERWILRVDTSPLKKYMKSVAWLKLRCGALCKEDNLDVFWGGATFLPMLPKKVRTIVTVHDINHIVVPDTMPTYTYWAYKLFFKRDIMRAGVVLANSTGTADRLYEYIGIQTNAVIKPAVSDIFRPQSLSEVQNCLYTYNICNPYILAVATWEPRKNLELLIETFKYMKKDGLLPDHKLILVGGKGWKDARLSLLVADYREDIVPLGYVTDAQLPLLYSGADIFVFPSVYEGFGMPVLEARACGARIVATDIPELREAGGINAIYITPTSEGIREGILKALSIGERSVEIDLPTWENGARKLASIVSDLQK